MNDEVDKLLQDALSSEAQYDPARAERVKNEVARMYERKLRNWSYLTWAYLAIGVVGMMIAIDIYILTSNLKLLIACAAMFLLCYEGTVLMKLWYWQMDTKLGILKELADLRLQMAELSEKKKSEENPDANGGKS